MLLGKGSSLQSFLPHPPQSVPRPVRSRSCPFHLLTFPGRHSFLCRREVKVWLLGMKQKRSQGEGEGIWDRTAQFALLFFFFIFLSRPRFKASSSYNVIINGNYAAVRDKDRLETEAKEAWRRESTESPRRRLATGREPACLPPPPARPDEQPAPGSPGVQGEFGVPHACRLRPGVSLLQSSFTPPQITPAAACPPFSPPDHWL